MQQAIMNAVQALDLTPDHPGYQIVNGPHELSTTDEPAQSILKLMHNFFDFGRGAGNWTWQSPLGTANGPHAFDNPRDRGINLLRGICSQTNCDGFRNAFINLATNILHIDGVGYSSIPQVAGQGYLTHPGTMAIDSNWIGNVRTETQNAAQVRSFKFSEHHFATFRGKIYDPTTNMTFANADEMKWCTYTLETNAATKEQFRRLPLFSINRVIRRNNICNNPHFLVEIGNSRGWPVFLLTAAGSLSFLSLRP
jgi:hypothetical protein